MLCFFLFSAFCVFPSAIHTLLMKTCFFMESINWKENKEVRTICFEIRIPMTKPKIFMEFYVSFRKQIFLFGFNNFLLEENKSINGNAFILWKSHWKIGLETFFHSHGELIYSSKMIQPAIFSRLSQPVHFSRFKPDTLLLSTARFAVYNLEKYTGWLNLQKKGRLDHFTGID